LHPYAKFRHCGLKKCGSTAPKIAEIGVFGINLPIGVYPLERIFTKFGLGTVSQVRTLTPNFTVLA